jgi:hypothetical protein
MSKRIANHLRSNVVGYVGVFLALSGVAYAGTANSIVSGDIVNGEVKHPDIASNNVRSAEVINDTFAGGGLAAVDLAADSVGSSEIAADTVGSSEIAPGVVNSDELATVHEHFGAATNIADGTAHDGLYATSTSTVSCGAGEDLLSVSVDWSNLAGHGEVMTSGVDVINRGTDPQSATVRAAFDGGAGPATYQAVATCI